MVQITANSYTGSLAAALTKSETVYHGPLTRAELSQASVCIPMFSQDEIDWFKKEPSGRARAGQFWGQRMLASERRGSFIHRFVAPDEPWNTSASMNDRMELCATIMRAAPKDTPMAMMVPKSDARAFLKNENCDAFELAPSLRFSSFEVGPQFVMASSIVKMNVSYLQTWNAVSKFISATEDFRALEQKYLGADFNCVGDSAADELGALTLYQQAGAGDQPSTPPPTSPCLLMQLKHVSHSFPFPTSFHRFLADQLVRPIVLKGLFIITLAIMVVAMILHAAERLWQGKLEVTSACYTIPCMAIPHSLV
jgi:hypothetical protein